MNHKMNRGSRNDYTDAEWDRIAANRSRLQAAECWLRDARAAWRVAVAEDGAISPMAGFRRIKAAQHHRVVAKIAVREALDAYRHSVESPPAWKRLAVQASDMIRERLEEKSFHESLSDRTEEESL